jgi:hypothetical protein
MGRKEGIDMDMTMTTTMAPYQRGARILSRASLISMLKQKKIKIKLLRNPSKEHKGINPYFFHALFGYKWWTQTTQTQTERTGAECNMTLTTTIPQRS